MDTEEVSNENDSMKQTKGVEKMTTQTYANLCKPMFTHVPKKNVMITLNPNLVAKAHELGLSISRIAENALIETITTLQGSFSQENRTAWCGRRDSNPGHRLGRPTS